MADSKLDGRDRPPDEGRWVDHKSLRDLVEFQLAEGTDGIIPCGTTGEAATLTAKERFEVVKTVVEQVRGRALVIAGAGSNATHEAIEG